MKFLLTLLVICASLSLSAAIITVNPDGSAQYANLQTAMNDATPGDTLLVSGEHNTTYYLEKQLHLFGSGFQTDQGYGLPRAYINSLHFRSVTAGIDPSGSTVSGFLFSYVYHQQSNLTISNVLFERNLVLVDVALYYAQANWTIRNNIIRRNLHMHHSSYTALPVTNMVENNFFEGQILTYDRDGTGVTIRNNIFSDSGQETVLHDIQGATINNNIFWRQSPGVNSADNCDGCSFNNNIVYYVNDATHAVYLGNPISGIYGTNVGANNLLFQTAADLNDPIFVNYVNPGGADWISSYDYHLDAGSAAGSLGISAGTDGTNIGVYGGAYPMPDRILPRIPHVTNVSSLQTSVPIGGTLQIQFSATKQD